MSKSDIERLTEVAWGAFSRSEAYRMRAVVVAVLQAIREPTEAQQNARCVDQFGEPGNLVTAWLDYVDGADVYRAMIDVLLDESR